MPSGNSIPRERPRVTQLRGRIVDSFPLVRRAIRSPLSSRDEHLREESTRRRRRRSNKNRWRARKKRGRHGGVDCGATGKKGEERAR